MFFNLALICVYWQSFEVTAILTAIKNLVKGYVAFG